MGGERIKLRVLIPLAIAIVGLMGAFVSGAFRLMNGALDDEVNRHLHSARKVIRARHHGDIVTLSNSLENLEEVKALSKAWIRGDSVEIQAIVKPFFAELYNNHGITHCYLHNPKDGPSLRVHHPGSFHDTTDHWTLDNAIETGRLSFGTELSSSGSFRLIVVKPWYIKKQLVGYIELGKEFKNITKGVPDALGVEIVALLDKRQIDREKWEKAYLVSHSTASWDDFTNFVVIDNSFYETPVSIDNWLSHNHDSHAGLHQQIQIYDRTYCVAFFPLIDARNRDVGDIAVFYDATALIARTGNLLMLITTMCLFIGVALFISFYKMLGSIETELAESRQKILGDSQLRFEIEQRHAKELATHVVEVELARSRALNMARQAERARLEAEKATRELQEKHNQPAP